MSVRGSYRVLPFECSCRGGGTYTLKPRRLSGDQLPVANQLVDCGEHLVPGSSWELSRRLFRPVYIEVIQVLQNGRASVARDPHGIFLMPFNCCVAIDDGKGDEALCCASVAQQNMARRSNPVLTMRHDTCVPDWTLVGHHRLHIYSLDVLLIGGVDVCATKRLKSRWDSRGNKSGSVISSVESIDRSLSMAWVESMRCWYAGRGRMESILHLR